MPGIGLTPRYLNRDNCRCEGATLFTAIALLPLMKLTIPLFGNELRIKYRQPLRWVEEKGHVRVLILGSLVIAY